LVRVGEVVGAVDGLNVGVVNRRGGASAGRAETTAAVVAMMAEVVNFMLKVGWLFGWWE
jgi:hypothetical protein